MNITKANLIESIPDLEKLGFKRWTKGNMDRMYINARDLGLDLSYYKTGNISGATLDGEHISNSFGRDLKAAKTYIDLNRALIVSDSPTLARKVAKLLGIEIGDGTPTQYVIA